MSKNLIKVKYLIDNDFMSDEEFENQQEKVLIITSDMIIDLIEENDKDFNPGKSFISYEYLTIEKI